MDELIKLVIKFRDDRDWKQFHNPKDMAISLSLEASELLEHFQWKKSDEMVTYLKTHKNEVSNELADVFIWVLTISHDLNIDLIKSVKEKVKLNAKKYPVKKSKGKHSKYTDFK
ncbi:TPA: nucleotide pyrophosphohydrolase [Candidatus Collierbacteria bacterium]|nr:nucleotide pyrophosphohydrolase [Candidatus Collierbacteria bacterium]HBO11000.1 nucleotide pyrophosphohydrolase [Candidatus Collierbacteria bacterium]